MAEAGKSAGARFETAFNDQAYPLKAQLPWNGPPRACPRGIGYMPFTWLEYHEWLNKHEEFKGN